MNLAGDFDLFSELFPTDLLPSIFSFVLSEWPESPRPTGDPIEIRITNRFVGHLRTVLRKWSLPFRFDYRPKLADPNADKESGEVDIRVRSFSPDPDAFFVCECKRLNVHYPSGFKTEAGEYVGKGGMGCFISGQYPATCNCGGMLGFVMDGDITNAVEAINQALGNNKSKLFLRKPYQLEQAGICGNDDRIRQTSHDKPNPGFLIYHLLVKY
ncbi:MAG: hypothetical protein AB7P49_20660 [Bdellovibrionales bacterium]